MANEITDRVRQAAPVPIAQLTAIFERRGDHPCGQRCSQIGNRWQYSLGHCSACFRQYDAQRPSASLRRGHTLLMRRCGVQGSYLYGFSSIGPQGQVFQCQERDGEYRHNRSLSAVRLTSADEDHVVGLNRYGKKSSAPYCSLWSSHEPTAFLGILGNRQGRVAFAARALPIPISILGGQERRSCRPGLHQTGGVQCGGFVHAFATSCDLHMIGKRKASYVALTAPPEQPHRWSIGYSASSPSVSLIKPLYHIAGGTAC